MTRQKSCHGCLGGKQYLAIAADGSIYFCSSLADAPEFKMGDVFAGIDREKQQYFDAQFNVNNRPECKTCWARNLCGGGCLWEARTTTGDPMSPNPVFVSRRAIAMNWRWRCVWRLQKPMRLCCSGVMIWKWLHKPLAEQDQNRPPGIPLRPGRLLQAYRCDEYLLSCLYA